MGVCACLNAKCTRPPPPRARQQPARISRTCVLFVVLSKHRSDASQGAEMARARLRNIKQHLCSRTACAKPEPLAEEEGGPRITNIKAIKTVGCVYHLHWVRQYWCVPRANTWVLCRPPTARVWSSSKSRRPYPVCTASGVRRSRSDPLQCVLQSMIVSLPTAQ